MPRFVPSVETTCRICGTGFRLQHDFDPKRGLVTTEPAHCPACEAPVKFPPAPSVGKAKSLLLTWLGLDSYVDDNGSVEGFLRAHCARPEDIDTYLALVEQMDYDAWEALNASLQKGRKPNPEQRKENEALSKLRTSARAGDLRRALETPARAVRSELVAERERHLAVFRARRSNSEGPA